MGHFLDPQKNASSKGAPLPPIFWGGPKLRVWAANIRVFGPRSQKWQKLKKTVNFMDFMKICHFLAIFCQFWQKPTKIFGFWNELPTFPTRPSPEMTPFWTPFWRHIHGYGFIKRSNRTYLESLLTHFFPKVVKKWQNTTFLATFENRFKAWKCRILSKKGSQKGWFGPLFDHFWEPV